MINLYLVDQGVEFHQTSIFPQIILVLFKTDKNYI